MLKKLYILLFASLFTLEILSNKTALDFQKTFESNLKNCTWNPHNEYSVFTQFDKEFYLSFKEYFLHKYKCFYAVAKTIAPKRIIEFGTNGGSGADAYLSGSAKTTEYIGYDIFLQNVSYKDTGKPWLAQETANKLFKSRGFNNYKIFKLDLRTIKKLPFKSDFIVVDAAHDFENQYQDLVLALTADPKYIFVDDSDGSEVANAISKFLKENVKSRLDYVVRIDYMGGGLVIKLK